MHDIYISQSSNPYFNLALEEYLVRHHKPGKQVLYLWQNQNTVVIGRNQNPWKECNMEELSRLRGCLVRRLSGGGAVYHDLGNLNYTFISPYLEEQIKDNIGVILQALSYNKVFADFSGKNDILVDGFKISGNAYFVENNILCHHGTLLLDVDFERLSSVLTVSKQKLESKGIDSIKSRVKNLKEFRETICTESLMSDLIRAFTGTTAVPRITKVFEESAKINIEEVRELKRRYESWEWCYGSSPEFNVEISEHFSWGEVTLYLNIKEGVIEDLSVATDALNLDVPKIITEHLLNTKFDYSAVIAQLRFLFDNYKPI